jgi:hypothetical protein
VNVDCYVPLVSKDANAFYTRTYDWDITKTVDPSFHSGFAGDSFNSDYTVTVDQTVTESDFAVSGTITVSNPSPDDAMTVDVDDSVDGVAVVLSCNGTLTVLAGDTATCDYSADLPGKSDGTNIATVTINGIGFSASADYAFGDPTTTVGDPSINVSDSNGESWQASGDATWSYSREFTCSTDIGQYTDGTFSSTYDNTATITETGQSSDASVFPRTPMAVMTSGTLGVSPSRWIRPRRMRLLVIRCRGHGRLR